VADHAKAKHLAKEHMKCNKPQRAPAGDTHKWVVKSCHAGEEKIVRYGRRGYEDYTQHKDPERRKNFRARMGCDKTMDKNTPRYWACNALWGKS
jgi:hypothetical protein